MSDKLTPREAEWLCCLLEAFTNTQERAADERIRQSAWSKLRDIAASQRANGGKVNKGKLKDLIGRRARLLVDIETTGGVKYLKGTIVIIGGVWRGRFRLDSIAPPPPGYGRRTLVRGVDRRSVQVLG